MWQHMAVALVIRSGYIKLCFILLSLSPISWKAKCRYVKHVIYGERNDNNSLKCKQTSETTMSFVCLPIGAPPSADTTLCVYVCQCFGGYTNEPVGLALTEVSWKPKKIQIFGNILNTCTQTHTHTHVCTTEQIEWQGAPHWYVSN